MSHEDRGAEKVLREKFLIGAEIFCGFDNFVFFFWVKSLIGLPFCVLLLSNWEEPLQRSIYAVRICQVPVDRTDVGTFPLHYVDMSKSGSVVPGPESNYCSFRRVTETFFFFLFFLKNIPVSQIHNQIFPCEKARLYSKRVLVLIRQQ